MNTNETSRFLDAVAADFIHEDVDLSLRVAARLEKENRPTLKNKIRFALALALILLAVGIALFRVPGVANAMKRMLGYIPGVGLVEEPTSLRVLAAPVSVTREGITLTVEQATLTQEKTVVLYTVEGIPQAARPKGESAPACQPATPTLSLPDGTQLQMEGGEGRGWENGYQSRMTFPPIPAGVDTAQFELPCLSDVAPGAAPQDWELSLRFVPAPPDLTVAPVIEVSTPAAATAAPTPVSQVASEPFLGITLNLESMTQTERGYILVTSLRWEGSPFNGVGTNSYQAMHLSDANGKALDLLPLDNTTFQSTAEPNREVLAFSLEGTAFTPPLTLSLDWAGISLAEPLRFTFDPGPNPQAGQQWPLDQDVSLLGYPVHVASARFVDSTELQGKDWTRFLPDEIAGFEFSLEADPLVQVLSLGVEAGFSADGSGTSGYSGRDEAGMLHSYALFIGKIETPLTIAASYAEVKHPWQVTWNPADLLTIAPAADSSLQISIQIEQVIPVEDGYYLLGRTTWQDARFAEVGMGGWDARLQGNGVEVPIEPASFHDVGISDVQPGQWLYKVYGKALPASLTLQMTQAGIQLVQPYTFTFDPGSDPQLGQEWSIDQSLDILGYAVTVRSATFVQQGESHGFAFELEADPALMQVPLSIVEGVTGGYSWGGGSSPRDSQGKIKVYALTNGQFSGPVRLAVQSVVLAGHWQTSWNPPAAEAGAQPQTVPQACVTLEQWNQSVASTTPAAVPA
ncbi:MAG: hypothetical protein GYA59_13285, partial [Chloroflexi bacterium]|nr:hypothetical protein [Chloroflexota bacterium]